MTGYIQHTSHCGGVIRPDNGTTGIPFSWINCDGIGPSDVGHGVMVEFYIEVVGRRDRAIAVRRCESKIE